MHKKSKIVFMVCAFFVLFICGGCSNNMMVSDDTMNGNGSALQWYQDYPLDSQEVVIYIANQEPPEDNATIENIFTIITVTNTEEISSLIHSVDFKNWRKANPEEEYDGVNYYFIQFNDRTTIGMYDSIAYGSIGRGAPGNIKDGDGYYYMPDKFLHVVQQLVEKYTK